MTALRHLNDRFIENKMWSYKQADGSLGHDGLFVGTGYSGALPDGKNNPAMEDVPNIGPCPRGLWTIGPPFTHLTKGPLVMRLSPEPTTETFGRSGFLIHGDSIQNPGGGSDGCIVMGHAIRQQIADSDDNDLIVV